MGKGKIAVISTQVYKIPCRGYGGLERIVEYQARGFKEMGYKVKLIAPKGSHLKGVEVIECCEPSLSNPEREAYEIYKDELDDCDIIYDHSWQKWAFYKREDLRKRIINILHGLEPFGSIPFDFFNCVCPSRFHANYVAGRYGIIAKYIYHGFPTDEFKPCYNKEDFMLFASRWSPYKGLHLFIEWCKKYKVKGIVIGDSELVEDKKYVEKCLKKADPKYVEIRGNVDEKERNELMRKAKAVVSPLCGDYKEIFGLVCIEANLHGTPILITDQGAPREIVKHKVSGWVAKDIFELEQVFEKVAKGVYTFNYEACRRWAEKFDYINMCSQYIGISYEAPW